MILAQNMRGAQQKVERDLRPHIEDWLIDGYVKQTPEQVEKDELLAVLNGLLRSIEFGDE